MTALYADYLHRVHNRVTDADSTLTVAAIIDENGPTVQVGDLDLTPGQARVLLAKVGSSLAHLDYLFQQGTA